MPKPREIASLPIDRSLDGLVSITKVEDPKSIESRKKATRKSIDLIGGMASIMGKGDLVLIKPNFFVSRRSETGATTDLNVLEEIVREVDECGAHPVIGEGPGVGRDVERVFEFLGVKSLAKKMRVKLVNLNEAEAVKVEVPGGGVLKEILLPKIAMEADAIINVPKMKTHVEATVTLGMKNLKGFMPGNEKLRSHILGLHQAIVDLNKTIKPKLTVVDGITAMEGEGPAYGDPVELGVVVAGRNAVAVDTVCCGIMGVEPVEVHHLTLAYNQGLKPKEIDVVGEPIEEVRRSFKHSGKYSPTKTLIWRGVYILDKYLYSRIFERSLLPIVFQLTEPKPYIVKEKCTSCGECVHVCPMSAISMEKKEIDPRKCTRCLVCREFCPNGAIKITHGKLLNLLTKMIP